MCVCFSHKSLFLTRSLCFSRSILPRQSFSQASCSVTRQCLCMPYFVYPSCHCVSVQSYVSVVTLCFSIVLCLSVVPLCLPSAVHLSPSCLSISQSVRLVSVEFCIYLVFIDCFSVKSQYPDYEFDRVTQLPPKVLERAPSVAGEGVRGAHQSATHLRGPQLQETHRLPTVQETPAGALQAGPPV